MHLVMRTLVVVTLVLGGCGKDKESKPTPAPDLPPTDRAELTRFSPLPPLPPDPTNAYADNERAAKLGQMLFFDEALSGPLVTASSLGAVGDRGKVACRTCHDGPALDDQRSPNHVSTGTAIGTRNSPPVLNSAFYAWGNWGGRFDSAWALVLGASEKVDVMNGNRLAIAHTLYTKYRADYDALFPVPLDAALDPGSPEAKRFPPAGKPKAAGAPDGEWEAMKPADREIIDRIFANYGKAVAAYMRRLVARNAPFDRYAAGDPNAISPEAKRGFALFVKHCTLCHDGPHFQDDDFHAIGVSQFGAGVPDADAGRFGDIPPLLASPFNTAGRYSDGPSRLAGLAQEPDQRGQFRTPTLRNVEVTAPYMHAGQFKTLEAVVKFYNIGGGHVEGITKDASMTPLELSEAQQAELVAFMKTLTDTKLDPALLVDTAR